MNLENQVEQIKVIADDYTNDAVSYEMQYLPFLEHLQMEYQKTIVLHKVYKLFYEHLVFKESFDLYNVIFRKFDTSSDRKFNRDEFQKLLINSMQIDRMAAL